MELPTNQLKLKSYGKEFKDLSKKDFYALKRSIERWGIIEPIVVNQDKVIICGRERYRAALLLGMEKVPVVVRKTNGDADIRDLSLEENLRRKHLTFSKNAQEERATCELKEVEGVEVKRRKKRRHTNSKKGITVEGNICERQEFGCRINTRLIPELSKLLDEGKINREAASLYATVSFESQKKIYGFIVNNVSHKTAKKMGNQWRGGEEGLR